MALQTLSACCTNGYLHNGKPKGAMMSVNGVQTYFAVPADESTSRALVIFSDVMGHNFVNTQLLADNFAANGFFTILPDLFRGDAVPLNAPKNFDVYEWLKYHLPEHTEPIIRTVIEETYRLAQWKTIVGVGYCFGAKYVLKYLKRGLLSAGYIAHPTLLDVQDILGVERPLSVAAAADDTVFTIEQRHELERMLRMTNVPFQINVFSDVSHGFAVRGDDNDPRGKLAKEQAFSQAVQWFKHHVVSQGTQFT